jgi:peptide/nickel transport system substrate-binding protein
LNRSLKITLAVLLALAALGGVAWYRADRNLPSDATGRGRITASIRSEPDGYNRYFARGAAGDLLSRLTDGRLIVLNRKTDEVEPALAERWTPSADGLSYQLSLRKDVRFSDGEPFTSADVLFSARVLYDADLNSSLGASSLIEGKPLAFAAPDPWTVTVTLPSPFAPGIRLLENLPILPRHKLETAFNEKRLREAWAIGTPLSEIAVLGPFVLKEHVAGQRLVFERNPHYWRRDSSGNALPYLDGITLLVVPDQNTEALRQRAGEIDLMVNGDIRPEDYAGFKAAADQGRLVLHDAGIGTDPNFLWFNLTAAARDRLAWLHDPRVRQAISYAVNRQAIVDTVYLGAAVPIYGPVSPANRTWHSATMPQYPYDPQKAAALLSAAGLVDRNGDRMLEDSGGRPVRFSILTNTGNTLRERTVALIQAHLKEVGIAVDAVTLDQRAVGQSSQEGDYDAIYFGTQASSLDPALNLSFWRSGGDFHVWNPGQAKPATPWEAEIDSLMARQVAASSQQERQQLFAEVQRIIGEQLPVIYFVAPRVTIAVSPRIRNATPVAQPPHVLWNAEMLAVDRK